MSSGGVKPTGKPFITKAPQAPKLVEMEVTYSDGAGGNLTGYVIYQGIPGSAKRPGLLVFPGPYGDGGGAHERAAARVYAKKGMVVFLPDYFPTRNSENDFNQVLAAVSQYQPFLQNSAKAQAIAKLGYEQLAQMPIVDANKISAIGFCFGGAMALNLARAGAKLVVAASLHGEYPHLDTKIGKNGATGTYNTQYFVEMVGLADPFIPKEAREAWISELQGYTTNTDNTFEFVMYGKAHHAFSIKYSHTFLNVGEGCEWAWAGEMLAVCVDPICVYMIVFHCVVSYEQMQRVICVAIFGPHIGVHAHAVALFMWTGTGSRAPAVLWHDRREACWGRYPRGYRVRRGSLINVIQPHRLSFYPVRTFPHQKRRIWTEEMPSD